MAEEIGGIIVPRSGIESMPDCARKCSTKYIHILVRLLCQHTRANTFAEKKVDWHRVQVLDRLQILLSCIGHVSCKATTCCMIGQYLVELVKEARVLFPDAETSWRKRARSWPSMVDQLLQRCVLPFTLCYEAIYILYFGSIVIENAWLCQSGRFQGSQEAALTPPAPGGTQRVPDFIFASVLPLSDL